MYDVDVDVVIDMDNVLLDLQKPLVQYFMENGTVHNVDSTYDFNNKSFTKEFITDFFPSQNMLKQALSEASVYKKATVNWNCISSIRYFADYGLRFLIHTVSSNTDVFLVKQALFTHWFFYTPNVVFKNAITGFSDNNLEVTTNTVVSANLDYLTTYSDSVCKFFINKTYNQFSYDNKYYDIINKSDVEFCSTEALAIERAVARAMSFHVMQ